MTTTTGRLSPLRRLQDALIPPALERGVSELAVRSLFAGARRLGAVEQVLAASTHDVEVLRDVRYDTDSELYHLLDVHRPVGSGPTPAVLYIHGGGFRILSKDTHEIIARIFAHRGYTVFNINYRLAPEHPFPTGLRDAARAYRWVVDNAERFGARADQLVVSGESSGANFATALAVMATYRRPEDFAKEVFDTGVVPAAVVPACGFLQVSDPLRLARRRPLSSFVQDRLLEAAQAYLPHHWAQPSAHPTLANPLRILEEHAPERALPPFFAAVGTRDPLLDDTRRLHAAVRAHGGACQAQYYPGELHSFHAFVWRENARAYWRDLFGFLGQTVEPKLWQAAGE